MDPEAIHDFLADQRDNAPAESQHIFLTLDEYWERKLWHQLTDTLLEYFSNPESASQRLAIYNTFILSFADKINQLKLVKLALNASTQCKSTTHPPTQPQICSTNESQATKSEPSSLSHYPIV